MKILKTGWGWELVAESGESLYTGQSRREVSRHMAEIRREQKLLSRKPKPWPTCPSCRKPIQDPWHECSRDDLLTAFGLAIGGGYVG